MDIITKIKNILMDLYSKKIFRISCAIIFLVLVLKHYSSIPENIKKNDDLLSMFSISKIKSHIEKETLLKEKKQKELKQKKLISEEKSKKIITPSENIKKTLDSISNINASKNIENINQNIKYQTKSIARKNDLVIAEMIIFEGKESNVVNKIDNMTILINDDKQNVFAKYLENQKVGYSVVIPVSDIVPIDKSLLTTNINYKITIKTIRSLKTVKK